MRQNRGDVTRNDVSGQPFSLGDCQCMGRYHHAAVIQVFAAVARCGEGIVSVQVTRSETDPDVLVGPGQTVGQPLVADNSSPSRIATHWSLLLIACARNCALSSAAQAPVKSPIASGLRTCAVNPAGSIGSCLASSPGSRNRSTVSAPGSSGGATCLRRTAAWQVDRRDAGALPRSALVCARELLEL